MSKYIGFDIDCKKVVACAVENGKKDIYETLGGIIERIPVRVMRVCFLRRSRRREWELSAVLSLMCRLLVSTNRSLGCQPDLNPAAVCHTRK